MSDFFAFPTVNSWEENVFQLTTAGIITVIVLILCAVVGAFIWLEDFGLSKLLKLIFGS